MDSPTKVKEKRRETKKQQNKDTQNSTADEDENDWSAIVGLHTGKNQSHSPLRADAPVFYPDNDTTPDGVDLDTDDDAQAQLTPETDDMELPDLAEADQDQGDASSESSASDQEGPPVHTPTKKYPFRMRKQKLIFTYDKLGQPSTSHI